MYSLQAVATAIKKQLIDAWTDQKIASEGGHQNYTDRPD